MRRPRCNFSGPAIPRVALLPRTWDPPRPGATGARRPGPGQLGVVRSLQAAHRAISANWGGAPQPADGTASRCRH